MNRINFRLGFATLAIVAGCGSAYAQTINTGGLTGSITDGGSPVAGATVTISSQAGTRTITSGPDGNFRFGLLNPGNYTITVTKADLQTFKGTATVIVGSSSTLNIPMQKLGSAVVLVVGSASAVDQSETKTGLAMTSDSIATLPKGRDINSLLYFSPGVTTSGFGGSSPSVGGGSGAENAYYIDGLSSRDDRSGFQGVSLVSDFIDQISVETGGLKAEHNALGGVILAVTKSGSNETKGSAWMNYDANTLAAEPKKGQYFSQAELPDRYDVGGDIGGAIIKDRLFYYVGMNATNRVSPGTTNLTGQASTDATTKDLQAMAKVSWQANQDHKVTFSSLYSMTDFGQDVRRPSIGDANFGESSERKRLNLNFSWDWTITPSMFLSVQFGRTDDKESETPKNNQALVLDRLWFQSGPGLPEQSKFGANTFFNRGGYDLYRVHDNAKATHLRADFSWYAGNHSVKAGFAYQTSEYALLERMTGQPATVSYYNYETDANQSISFNEGYRDYLYPGAAFGLPSSYMVGRRRFIKQDALVKAQYQSVYVQDVWEVTPGFRAHFGVRMETQEQNQHNGGAYFKFKDWAENAMPRLGFTWDPTNDGRSKFFLNYAKTLEQIPQQATMRTGGNETFREYFFYMPRTNYNSATGAYNPSFPGSEHSPEAGDVVDYGIYFQALSIAEGTKLPNTHEMILGYEQTLKNGWTVGITAKQRETKDGLEDSVLEEYDGTPYDGEGWAILWNPGSSARWQNNKNHGSAPGATVSATGMLFPETKRIHQSVELKGEKKSDRGSLNVSYTWSRLYGNYEGLVSSSNGQADANITASWDHWSYVGYGELPLDRTHAFKAFGSYGWDLGGHRFSIGGNLRVESGTPISKLTNGATSSPVLPDLGEYINAIPENNSWGQYGRTPVITNLDLRVEYQIKIGNNKLIPSVDIFNVFNTRSTTGVFQTFSQVRGLSPFRGGAGNWPNGTVSAAQLAGAPNWGKPNGAQSARQFRFGLKFQF